MKNKGMKDVLSLEILLLGVGVAVLVWTIDILVDVFLFNKGSIIQQIFAPEPFKIYFRGTVWGIIVVFSIYAQSTINKQNRRAEEELKQRSHQLGERVKELNCLYGVSKLTAEPDKPLSKIFQETVDSIPQSWQYYPGITCAIITCDGQEFKTDDFKKTEWKQSADIAASGTKVGTLEVYYAKEKPEIDEGPFLKEERSLIDALGKQLGNITGRKRAEEKMIEREQEAVLLHKMNSMFSVSTSKEKIFSEISSELVSTFGYDSSAILIPSKDPKYLEVQSYFVDSNHLKNTENILSAGLLFLSYFGTLTGKKAVDYNIPLYEGSFYQRLAESKEPIFTDDVEALVRAHTDEKSLQALAPTIAKLSGMKYGMGAPLIAGDRLVGIMGVANKKELTQKDAERLARVGEQIGPCVERATFYEEVEEAYRELRKYALRLEEAKGTERELLETIEWGAKKQVEIIELAGTLSKLKSVGEMEKKSLDLKEAVDKAVEYTEHLFKAADMRVENNVTESMPVDANSVIENVFSNLLSNAVRYASDGKKVVIDALEEDKSHTVVVKDYGPGIPDKYKEDIFERFMTKETTGVQGTGLGLAIARGIMDIHSGKVWVEDNPEGGAVFKASLPK
ncbi:MAG: GAF domain-containing sensor histidine kinase [Candidatus Hydrothermarchaeaceae archaeon]